MDFTFKPGQVVITQGDPKSMVSWAIRLATKSWWTHGFVVTGENQGIEAVFPRVVTLTISDRLKELEAGGRDFIVMDLPGITDEQRVKVAQEASSFNHRMYDLWNCLYYLCFKVWVEGGKRVICSRLMAASFFGGINRDVFSHVADKLPKSQIYRELNMEDGYCTPDEFLRYSDLEVVYRHKS